jgi:hypothetical protein
VNRSCNHFLANTALARDQDFGIGAGYPLQFVLQIENRLARADHPNGAGVLHRLHARLASWSFFTGDHG